MDRLPCVLTIAGSDSGGGAGIQADIKTISMLGGYAASVITALTAQNTKNVTGIHAPSSQFVAQQLLTVTEDIQIDAAKTGMLFSEPIIEAIAPLLRHKKYPLVVDPVCVATSGAKLLKEDAVDALIRLIFPCADILTPNIPEAEMFTGIKISDREDVFRAARILLDMGPHAVLIKGGHSQSWAITDWFVARDRDPIPFLQQRVQTISTHGTGCTLSAAIATGLAQGLEIEATIKKAQEYLNLGLRASFPIGEGGGPPNHLAPWLKVEAREKVLSDLNQFCRWLEASDGIAALLPKGRGNIAISLPYAKDLSEVASMSGGIVGTHGGDALSVGFPDFGVSERTGATLLAVQRLNPEVGCAVTLGLTKKMKQVLHLSDFESIWIKREGKPDYISLEHGRFEEWGTFTILKEHKAPGIVEAIADPGGYGYEPVLRLLAKDVGDLVEKMKKLFKILKTLD
ncbi:bifunctional hydroxymethylpyrimidine kinase/phosphomethylpyrimidine kinase [Pseudodesulfovibrio piezophilus]|uniref:hydroxymethylpyrimidine kinase n=1 Tax=Pseudodesulfovibrio piezophilus (strain DSM 21447 / JCM 15486 / C1TLV30) TaxID=1322246 RepID=M1WQ75_PSEP2|nr:bifunctional hydroxymethylpyrimidine kinase/phosphomethylpyrimidine kinase [Pseudodesulfovibrio piezophilus]CCH47537.1 Phosphomethylpyrimidine kinase [Pseudodesulfovibrio piezophilus C1TLV30]